MIQVSWSHETIDLIRTIAAVVLYLCCIVALWHMFYWRKRLKLMRADFLGMGRDYAQALDTIAVLKDALQEAGLHVPTGAVRDAGVQWLRPSAPAGLVSPPGAGRVGSGAAGEPLSGVPAGGGLSAPSEAAPADAWDQFRVPAPLRALDHGNSTLAFNDQRYGDYHIYPTDQGAVDPSSRDLPPVPPPHGLGDVPRGSSDPLKPRRDAHAPQSPIDPPALQSAERGAGASLGRHRQSTVECQEGTIWSGFCICGRVWPCSQLADPRGQI